MLIYLWTKLFVSINNGCSKVLCRANQNLKNRDKDCWRVRAHTVITMSTSTITIAQAQIEPLFSKRITYRSGFWYNEKKPIWMLFNHVMLILHSPYTSTFGVSFTFALNCSHLIWYSCPAFTADYSNNSTITQPYAYFEK